MSLRARTRALWAIIATIVVMQLVQNAHPEWAWLGVLNLVIAYLIMASAVASLVWLIIRGRRAYNLLMNRDATALERFAERNHLPRSGQVIEGEIVTPKKAKH